MFGDRNFRIQADFSNYSLASLDETEYNNMYIYYIILVIDDGVLCFCCSMNEII